MNPWLRELVTEHLITAGGVNPTRANDVVDSLDSLLKDRHLCVVPAFLSDEMFQAQLQINPSVVYSEQSQEYRAAVWAYMQVEINNTLVDS
ncbi:hypothetical protein UFOVP29_67 [uncultured Caudovirales phage]|uniref:Uncharacterized protein n=1 Tax=uncultured Caudovirales phage TaxID=2100421 RepID=A0A6J5KPE3_9CAUD|nr:hypothetical protein UFOVP29_67 [uncultured Caudovirales phage]